jgi:tRNA(Ile)-lysidine synthase
MIKMITKVPNEVGVAFSGGVDSLAIAHFLKRGKKNVTLFHFNHGCEYSDEIEAKCIELADQLGLEIILGNFQGDDRKLSLEDKWRRARYKFLRSFECKIITGHHLDDAVETWCMTCVHGFGRLIPVESGNIIRPFLLTEKSEFEKYCKINNLQWVEDPYNGKMNLVRNYMRANVMEHLYHINPGLKKVIYKKYLKEKQNV